MSLLFHELVEEVKHRPLAEQLELKEVIEHELIRARREGFVANHLEALQDLHSGKLKPTSDVEELMRRLEEE